jgi:hypothetical protein
MENSATCACAGRRLAEKWGQKKKRLGMILFFCPHFSASLEASQSTGTGGNSVMIAPQDFCPLPGEDGTLPGKRRAGK